jgi:sugar phosphate isomerase/epimerase
MALPVTIICAPCCWGVDDVSNPYLPHWERVLDEAAEAGFGGLELGPYGGSGANGRIWPAMMSAELPEGWA